jgi:hypothetical protein
VRPIRSTKKESSRLDDMGLVQLASRDARRCACCDGHNFLDLRRFAHRMVERKRHQANISANIEVRGRVQTEAH